MERKKNMADNKVGFPVPDLVDEHGKVIRFDPKTNVGAGIYTRTSARGGAHEAMDIYSRELRQEETVRVGSDVVAIANATARFQPSTNAGNSIRITFRDEDGHRYTADYRHLASISSKFKEKDEHGRYREVKVEKGDVIGQVGDTGNVRSRGIPYPILCFAMTRDGVPIDPYKVFGKVEYEIPRLSMDIDAVNKKPPRVLKL